MGRRRGNLGAMWTAGRLAARQALGRSGARDLELGRALSGQLDQMKGLAMKLGQIVSYMDVPLPEEVQAELAKLQQGTQGRPLESLEDAFLASLGTTSGEAFDAIEAEPVAAASIGQVHRAVFDGVPVAVKVQYPEIAATFASDLAAVGRLASLASLASAVDGRAIVRELAERLTEECDYEREARAQTLFAERFAGDPHLRVPPVVPERSGARVLTTRWIEFSSFEEFSEHARPEERGEAARHLIRFTYQSLLELGLIQADPHPGNFGLVREPLQVVCFDFGCVRELDAAMVDGLREMSASVLADDRKRFRASVDALGLVGVERRFDYDHHYAAMRHLHRPFLEADFAFAPAYVRGAMAFNGPSSPNARSMAMPPAYIWVARLQWGLWSVLTRLGARGDFREVLRDCLGRPPSLARVDGRVAGTSPGLGATI